MEWHGAVVLASSACAASVPSSAREHEGQRSNPCLLAHPELRVLASQLMTDAHSRSPLAWRWDTGARTAGLLLPAWTWQPWHFISGARHASWSSRRVPVTLMSSSLSRADARFWQPLEVTTNPIISPPWCPGSLGRCDRDRDRQCPSTYPSQTPPSPPLPPQIPSVVTLTHQRSANSVRWDSGTNTGPLRSRNRGWKPERNGGGEKKKKEK